MSFADPLAIPDLAVMETVPVLEPAVASPVLLIDATILADVDQLAVSVTSFTVPSL